MFPRVLPAPDDASTELRFSDGPATVRRRFVSPQNDRGIFYPAILSLIISKLLPSVVSFL